MVRKGMSMEEKRQAILSVYHERKEPMNLKEIEKLGAAKGVVSQVIKDVNLELVGDNLVNMDKIGASNFFWSFPAAEGLKVQRRRDELLGRVEELRAKRDRATADVDAAREGREEDDAGSRAKKLKKRAELQQRCAELDARHEQLKENDPKEIARLAKQTRDMIGSANRWIDNIFAIKSWLVKKKARARTSGRARSNASHSAPSPAAPPARPSSREWTRAKSTRFSYKRASPTTRTTSRSDAPSKAHAKKARAEPVL